MAFYGIAQATMAPAGIDINNTATSEYINDRGQNKTTESNTVTIKVLPVFSATLTPAPDAIGSPNQIIKWLHTLTNTGNIEDTFQFSALDGGGDNGNLENIRLIYNDGVNDIVINPATSIPLKVGESVNFRVEATVPQSVTMGDSFNVDIEAKGALPASAVLKRTDKVLTVGPALTLLKNVDKVEVNLSLDDVNKTALTYTLDVSNTGNATATPTVISIDGKNENKVIVEDMLPTGGMLKAISYSGGGQVLYHAINDGEKVYHRYDTTTPPDLTQINGIALAFDDYVVGRKEQVIIQTNVTSTTIGAFLNNQFKTYYRYGNSDLESLSNTVSTKILGKDATLTAHPELTLDPGTVAVWKHTLTNTGNLADSYTFALADVLGGKGVLGNVQLILDANKNGIYDAGDVVLTSATPAVPLNANETLNLLVLGTVPINVQPDDFFSLNLTVTTGSPTPKVLTQIDTVKTVTPAVELVKTVDKLDVDFKAAATTVDVLTYTLTATNKGITPLNPVDIFIDGIASKKVIFKDIFPANVTLLNDKDPANLVKATENTSGKGAILYHLSGEAEKQLTL